MCMGAVLSLPLWLLQLDIRVACFSFYLIGYHRVSEASTSWLDGLLAAQQASDGIGLAHSSLCSCGYNGDKRRYAAVGLLDFKWWWWGFWSRF